LSKIYCSTDLGINSSGGTVVKHELDALRSIDNIIEIGPQDTHPLFFGLPDIPFLIDYFTLKKLSSMDLSGVDLAHFYGGCYTETIKYLKSKGIKPTYTIMWHDRKISIEEHDKMYGDGTYPFIYVKDDKLFNLFCGGIKEADCVIAAGTVPRNLMLKEGAKRVEIVPLGCDIPEYIEPLPEKFDIGNLGAVGPDKGPMYLIQAWDMLNYKDSTLIFAGPQSHYVPQMINKYAIGGQYHIMGHVQHPADLYNKCSVYVQFSSTEGFGMEIPEAMSCGRPVIVSDGAGACDCVTDGVDGFVVPKRDVKALAAKIDWCKNHPKELIQMGNNAREKSFQYTWEKTKQKYVDLWRSLL
jgi:glycosyltransferase involved in cell wall biosynthesis